MTGFLSVLAPPAAVPHLREFALELPAFSSPALVQWLSARSEALLAQLGGQQEALAAITEVARRTNGSAERLSRLAEVMRSKMIHHAALSPACHWMKGESLMKKAVVTRVHRGRAAEAGWQEWISETAVARAATEVTVPPKRLSSTNDCQDLHQAIARLAYENWQARGCPSGSPEEDWLRAEKQLVERMNAG